MKRRTAKTASQVQRPRLLLACLLGMGLLYLALLPRLRQMAAETERLKRQAAAGQAQALHLANLRQALDAARARVERDPRDAHAQLELTSRLNDAGQLDEAARHARLAAELLARDAAPLLLLADIERRSRRYDAAVDAYKAALRREPTSQQALTGLAFLYNSFGWPREAEALLEPAVRAAPNNPYLKVALAAAYWEHETFGPAERLLLEVRRLAPEDASLWSPLAQLYIHSRRERDAVEVARAALARLPGDVTMLHELGRAYFRLHDLPQAVATFRQILQIDPESVPAHYSLGLCYRSLKDSAAAIRELEFVLQRDPAYEQTRLFLGRLYLQANRAEAGRKLLGQFRRQQARARQRSHLGLLVASEPRNPEAHWRLAQLYQEQGDRPYMIVELRKTLELAPHHDGARRLLAAYGRPGG